MKVKISPIGFMDMLKFKNMAAEREKAIEAAPDTPLPTTDRINELAGVFHPQQQFLRIEAIIKENKDTKTLILAPDREKGTVRIAPFKAGSCLNLSVKIGDSVASRVYSISSSPKDACYRITVKRKPGGFLSEYLLDRAEEGERVTAGEPYGTMTYSSIRDGKTVIAVAGGTGITPFLSMAKAIADQKEDFKLIILYGARTQEDIVFYEELKAIMSRTDKVSVEYILSDEQKEGFRHGLISADVIREYLPKESVSIFAAGPVGMCEYLEQELKKLNLPQKNIRIEQTGGSIDRQERAEYRLTVRRKGESRTIGMYTDETVLTALERSGIAAPNKCRTGGCGFCRSRLIRGTYQATAQERLRMADREFGYFHPCCSYPCSDMEIEIY